MPQFQSSSLLTSDIDDDNSVAIIGLASRLPGDATTPENFWDLICNGRSTYSEVPKDRFRFDAFQSIDTKKTNTMTPQGGHFLRQDVAEFDANFFNISHTEAAAIDPQQRMMLEVVYEAFENACLSMDSVAGTATGCFMGCSSSDYRETVFRDVDAMPTYCMSGCGYELISNRTSFFFDLKGPSFTLGTACSSGMVAFHQGCQSIRAKESKMAVVGASNLLLNSEMFIALSNQNFLSSTGCCHPFDSAGNGYGRAEGIAAIILKNVGDAIRDGDPIRAIVRGSGANQNGQNQSITRPNARAQADLIRSTYQLAGVDMKDVNYVEAHGTGTEVGDPTELEGIAMTLGAARGPNNPLFVGSVKSNIGHLEATAGFAGIIKAIHVLERGLIPPNVNLHVPNPRIPFHDWNLKVPRKLEPWPTEGPRFLSVQAFGYGGTNAHAILHDARSYLQSRNLEGNHFTEDTVQSLKLGTTPPSLQNLLNQGEQYSYQSRLFVLSSHDKEGLNRQSGALLSHLQREQLKGPKGMDTYLCGLAFTLSEKRRRLPWKVCYQASSTEKLAEALQDHSRVKSISRPTSKAPRIGFVFTGQGAQWPRMGVELLQYRVFRESISDADDYLCRYLGCPWSVMTELTQEASSNMNLPAYCQPLCAIVQMALVDLLETWDIRPSFTVGHSSGEIAGAYCIGALSKEDAWTVAYSRGFLSSHMKSRFPMLKGRMMAVGLSREDAEKLVKTHVPDEVVVACVNSPSSVTLSGSESGIHVLQKILNKSGAFARELAVDTAYHSPHMETISAEYFEAIAGVIPRDGYPERKMYSAVTGDVIEASELGPINWVRNLVSPVLFYDALLKLLQPTGRTAPAGEAKVDLLLEIGPHSALKGPSNQTIQKHGIKMVDYFSVLRRGENAVDTALSAVSELYSRGVPVDVSAVNDLNGDFAVPGKPLVSLPPYSWNHSRRYWAESRVSKQQRLRERPQKSLIGAPCPSYGENESLWRGFLRLSEEPWVGDHKIQSSILYPAAGFLAMAMEGALQTKTPGRNVLGVRIKDFQIIAPAIINEDIATELILQIRPHHASTRDDGYSWQEFTISTCDDDHESLKKNCFGLLTLEYEAATESGISIEKKNEANSLAYLYNDAEVSCQSEQDPITFYELLETLGFNYGPLFRNLTRIKSASYRSCCEITIADSDFSKPREGPGRPHIIHPSTLDAMFHCVFAAFNHDSGQMSETMVPQSIEEMYVSTNAPYTAGSRFKGFSDANKHGFREMKGNITMLDKITGEPSVMIKNFYCTSIPGGQTTLSTGEQTNVGKLYSKETWQPALDVCLPSDIASLISGGGGSDTSSESVDEVEIPGFLTMLNSSTNLQIQNVPMEQLQKFAFWLEVQPSSAKILEDHQSSLEEFENRKFKRQIVKGIERRSGAAVSRAEANSPKPLSSYRIGWPLARVILSQANVREFLVSYGLRLASDPKPQKANGWVRNLAQYVGLLAHRDPDLSILEIGDVISNQAVSLLFSADNDLQDSLECAHYTFTTSDDRALADIEAQFRQYKRPIHVAKLDLKQKLEMQAQDVKQYDLVILPDISTAFMDLVLVLANLKRLVKTGGKLCIVRNTGPHGGSNNATDDFSDHLLQPSIQQDTLLKYLKENSFTIDFNVSDFVPHRAGNPRLIIATANLDMNGVVNGSSHYPDICLLEPSNPSEKARRFAGYLRDVLEGKGFDVRKITLGQGPHKTDQSICISLLELEKPFWSELDHREFLSIRRLILECPNLLWVTAFDNPTASMAFGALRTVRNEVPGNQYRAIRLDSKAIEWPEKYAALLSRLANTPTKDHEFVEEAGFIKTCRYSPDVPFVNKMCNLLHERPEELESIPLREAQGPQRLAIKQPAMLDTLCLETAEDQLQVSLADDEIEMEVKATGLNFRDVMVVMGQIPDTLLGFEASGVVRRTGRAVIDFKIGDKICALGHGAHRTLFRNKALFCQKMPEGFSFEDAATLPLVHCTAYHALFHIAKPRAGQTILIHAAAGGVGQSAIQLAKHLGLEIFATVGSLEKRELIESLYGVQPDHIFSSRDLSFAKGVMRMTKGRGVDVILNSLSGEALQQSWQCIAAFGTFVEIGMKDILVNTGLEMRPFLQDASFHFFNLKHVMTDDPDLMTRILKGTFENLRRGVVRPVFPVKVYPISEVENAFRLLQTGKHQGKIALKWNSESIVSVVRSKHQELQLDPRATYVLVGGFGGIGRSLSNLLADSGAKSLCFLSRAGPNSQSAQATIKGLEERGINVRAYSCDIGDKIHLSSVLQDFSISAPPIKGVFQCAMSLQDSLFERMSYEQWTTSLRPKVKGSWNLHESLPKNLDFFIMLSSFAAIFGNRSQSNYAAAGAFQDALAHHRRKLGLRAIAIDLGVMRDVGVLAEKGATDYLKEWEKPFGMREQELHTLIKTVLISETGQKSGPSRLPAQIIHGFGNGDMVREAGIRTPFYFDDPRFSILTREGPQTSAGGQASDGGAKSASLQEQLKQMASLSDAVTAITSALVARLATSLQVDIHDIDEAQALHRYGVDSLVGIEVSNWVFQQTRVKVSVFDIMASTSIAEFAQSLAEKSELMPKESTD